MILICSSIIFGFLVLMWSADKFINGAVALAHNMGMSPMIIGITVVSIGTSSPEILVTLLSTLTGHSNLAVGNVLGSNIANIGLVMGITLIISPMPFIFSNIKKELLLLIAITLLASILLIDHVLAYHDSILLLAGFLISLLLLFHWQKQSTSQNTDIEIPNISTTKAALLLTLGLIVMIISSRILIWGAIEVARALKVSELIIGLSIVALGTSLPELAASVMSALKKHHDIAIGNIIGSNLFNLVLVMAVPGFTGSNNINSSAFNRDVPVMLALTFILFATAFIYRNKQTIGRMPGVIMLICYLSYTVLLYLLQ